MILKLDGKAHDGILPFAVRITFCNDVELPDTMLKEGIFKEHLFPILVMLITTGWGEPPKHTKLTVVLYSW